ncbi:hypothetical protein THASP1DRAFT_31501 [Thamnocephalis sphaerospora]|uniref:Conserved oligomeric Golgi complex subunit 3 n=1 Tax=Thamnocephalis sphaerospora TaxID=78915 RepID=A0A4P9XN15_9FUNG|nr:hypothetical protein THASP1DRAFT_31501 [Thamnocephalis sphaerospora]|eukprot:RKP06690.1 hypothetical protein THASP1DRAFT_31501 [Thamnocephalis sphaerospora]
MRTSTAASVSAAERLLERREHLQALADAIAKQLDYFDRLSHLVRLVDPANAAGFVPSPPTPQSERTLHDQMPTSPLDALLDADAHNVDVDEDEATRFVCLRTDFLPTLDAMEESIEFLTSRAKYREAPAYLEKFMECRLKACQLIQRHAASAWLGLAREVARKLEAKEQKERHREASLIPLLYVKFRAVAPELRPLVAALERLAARDARCADILDECRSSYLDTRQRLLGPLTEERLSMAEQADGTLVHRALDSLTYITSACSEERALYAAFFAQPDAGLAAYTGRLSQPLYEHLRTPILRETDPRILEELCAVVRAHLPADYDDQIQDNARSWEQATGDMRPLLALQHVLHRKLEHPDQVPSESCSVM